MRGSFLKVPIKYQGAEIKIGFNPQYILEVLRVAGEPQVTFELTDNTKPGLIRIGKDFLYVLMPVTI